MRAPRGRYRFKRIVGVEFSREFDEIAANRDPAFEAVVPSTDAGGYENVAWQLPVTALKIAYWMPLIVDTV